MTCSGALLAPPRWLPPNCRAQGHESSSMSPLHWYILALHPPVRQIILTNEQTPHELESEKQGGQGSLTTMRLGLGSPQTKKKKKKTEVCLQICLFK